METVLSRLPSEAKLTYAAEGGANVVYRIVLPPSPAIQAVTALGAGQGSGDDRYGPGTPPTSELQDWEIDPVEKDEYALFRGKILRLRKKLETASTVLQAYKDYKKLIVPLFKAENLIEQAVVEVPVEVLERLDEELGEMERMGTRLEKRSGVYLSREGYGLLMADASGFTKDSVSLEIKPKWLAQSPSAPEGAKNCRTCALRLLRKASQQESPGPNADEGAVCPLGFVAGRSDRIIDLVRATIHPSTYSLQEYKNLQWHMANFVGQDPLLRTLKEAQCSLDASGVFYADPQNESFLAAMTLRDCSLYLKIPLHSGGQVDARLGDLDLKSPSKRKYWKSVEQQLIDEGWYMAGAEERSLDTTSCFLQEHTQGGAQ